MGFWWANPSHTLFSEIRGPWLQCDLSEDPETTEIGWIRLLSSESNQESIVALESKFGVQDNNFSEDDPELIGMLDDIEKQAISPEPGDGEWSAVFDEIAFLRAWREYESCLCPNCLKEVDVRVTVCPGCVGVMVANGKIERVVPRSKKSERTPSRQRVEGTAVPPTAPDDNDIQKVVNEARELSLQRHPKKNTSSEAAGGNS